MIKIIKTQEERYRIIERANKMLGLIYEDRSKEDTAYEIRWRKRRFLPDRPDTKFPPENFNYPCEWYTKQEYQLKRIIKAIQELEDGESITLDDNDLSRLGW